ncbi:unnamed protein product [Gadus morhua 'NCC']
MHRADAARANGVNASESEPPKSSPLPRWRRSNSSSTVNYSAVNYSTVHCSTVTYSPLTYSPLTYSTISYGASIQRAM